MMRGRRGATEAACDAAHQPRGLRQIGPCMHSSPSFGKSGNLQPLLADVAMTALPGARVDGKSISKRTWKRLVQQQLHTLR